MEINITHNMDIRDGLYLLDDKSIDMTITSPPYWGLRDYGDETETIWDGNPICNHDWSIERTSRPNQAGGTGDRSISGKGGTQPHGVDYHDRGTYSSFCSKCGAWRGQLGLEPTPDLYIKHLCDIYEGIRRVLKDKGTCWVNIGDTYSGSMQGYGAKESSKTGFQKAPVKAGFYASSKNIPPMAKCGIPRKSLVMIPFRFALEMVNRGWILRNTIIWHKPNAMPSSVRDRFTVDFEYLFFFSKKERYFFEQQREGSTEYFKNPNTEKSFGGESVVSNQKANRPRPIIHTIGRNKRTTWSITTRPFPEAHFAVFPEDLVEIPIKACCPEFICKKCGKPKTTKRIKTGERPINMIGGIKRAGGDNPTYSGNTTTPLWDYILTPNCECNAGFKAGIVLDPFMGAGTTALMCKKLNRNYIGFEINPKYIEIINKRLEDNHDNNDHDNL